MNLVRDFPGLDNLTYLDSAASSQTPLPVIEAMTAYLRDYRANVHRGAYALSGKATEAYEEARGKVAHFLGAASPEECIFTRGTTESLNLLASSLLQPGERIVLSAMEHHSNIVPWQLRGLEIDWVEVDSQGKLDLQSLDQALLKGPRAVALTWVSNVLGTINPISEIARRVHQAGALFILDGAQGVPHLTCNLSELGCDFLAFSGHKMLGPTGIGVLWGKSELLQKMPPYQGGGSMIARVTRTGTSYAPPPQRFEAGTPAIAEAIGLGAAVDYLQGLGMDWVRQHEKTLLTRALVALREVPDLRLFGPCDAEIQSGVVSFWMEGVHPHDLATILDRRGICIRAGHHCCQPLMASLTERFQPGSRAPISLARASFYLYNQDSEIEKLVEGLLEARKVFRRA